MRKILAVVMILAAFGLTAAAQDLPKAEVFGGYSYFRADVHELKDNAGLDKSGFNLNGWNGAVTGFVTKNFGITADFSGNYGKPTISVTDPVLGTQSTEVTARVHNFLFGPTVAYRTDRASIFGHALFGGTKARMTVPGSFTGTAGEFAVIDKTAFAYALGGGVDINANKHFAIRVAQFDWINTKVDTTSEFQTAAGVGAAQDRQNNIRFSAGVVFKF